MYVFLYYLGAGVTKGWSESVRVVLLETNLELKLRTVFLRECKLVSFHNSIFLFSGRFIGADGAVSTRTMSWSLMSGITLHFRTRLGRFVMKMSRVLLPLVGNLITCSRPVSYRVSSMNLLIESGYWVEVTVLLFQLMWGRFMAPAIQMVEFLNSFCRFVIVLQTSCMYGGPTWEGGRQLQ